MLSAAFCLIQSKANGFLKAIQKGELDPVKMAEMTSEQRHALLEKYVGKENATQVNSLYESKLLLKNQEQGLITWIKKTGNLTPAAKRDLISRVQRMDRVLNPEETEAFKKDLASTKLGTDVTQEEAKKVYELSKKVEETQKEGNKFDSKAERLAYGRSRVELINYINELKSSNNPSSLNPIEIAKNFPGITKSIRASLDNSAIFRQGWKSLFTNPVIWGKNATNSFIRIARDFGGKKVMDEVNADIVSRPTYDLMVKAKLAVANIEEAFPSSLPEKIPFAGKLYKVSENAYTGFVHNLRADIFDKYIKIAQDQGMELTTKELQSIGSMVNSMTGRGNMGRFEGSAVNLVNNVFFSPRNIKSQFDTLGHVLTGAGGSNFVRKQAAINLVKVISGIATIMTVANAVRPGSAETDPRSSDFGKIKVGDTRFDISGGMSSMVTLAARLASLSSKSSVTGNVTTLNAKDKAGKPAFGAKTGKDVVVDYLTNKLSPAASVVKDLLTQSDFEGKPLTLVGEAKNLLEPLPLATFEELQKNPNSANTILAMIADALGISTNTYSAPPVKPKKESTTPKKVNFGLKNHSLSR